MCQHDVTIKLENGMVITYCKKCGQILDSKQANQGSGFSMNTSTWENGLIKDNGGQILHD